MSVLPDQIAAPRPCQAALRDERIARLRGEVAGLARALRRAPPDASAYLKKCLANARGRLLAAHQTTNRSAA